MESKDYAIMSLSAVLDHPNNPVLEFCGQFDVVITSPTFVPREEYAVTGISEEF